MQNKSHHNFKKIGIAGVGLIGGSFAKAFKAQGIELYGYDISLEMCMRQDVLEYFNGITTSKGDFLANKLDLIYICLPMLASLEFIQYLADNNVTCCITDAGSVKTSSAILADKLNLNFCGGHPIRGKETSGFDNAEKDLFVDALHVLTPTKATDKSLVDKLTILHESIGMRISVMDAEKHDNVFALVSHLPHIAAFTMVETAMKDGIDTLNYIGGGFRDFTRIAASDATMWADVFIDNADNVLESIEEYEKILQSWKQQIIDKDREKLLQHIKEISNIRRGL